MLKLFKKAQAVSTASPMLVLHPPYCPSIHFEQFNKGIDNVHIDVYLGPAFTNLCYRLIHDLLVERTTHKRRFSDKLSKVISARLDQFSASYASMLTAVIHRAKENQQADLVQLFEIAVVKFLLNAIQTKAETLLHELRRSVSKEQQVEPAQICERIAWIDRNQNNLLYQLTHEVFAQMQWVESGPVSKLRESSLGVRWSIAEEVLFNPLLRTSDVYNHALLMKHYVLLSPDPDNYYGFERLENTIDRLLEEAAVNFQLQFDPPWQESCASYHSCQQAITTVCFSWKDVPDNVDLLFDTQNTLMFSGKEQASALKQKLHYQHQAKKILVESLRKGKVISHILAAYETPRLHDYYAKLLKPYLIYQVLCGEVDVKEVIQKLQNQLKKRPLRRPEDKRPSLEEIYQSKKRLQHLTPHAYEAILLRFVKDFMTYRRDLKYRRLMQEAMANIHLVMHEADVQLSRANGLLYEFFEQDEYNYDAESIRCHVVVTVELRGAMAVTNRLCQQGLNPATYFSRHFFDPIQQLLEDFGAEKVSMESNAAVFSLFEYQNVPEHWLATARACGLAHRLLDVLKSYNSLNRDHQLPELEIGVGICYCPDTPKFLYDGNQRIMISSAIDEAKQLSACSSELRHHYATQQDTQKHLAIFKQPLDEQGKSVKTLRYNLNGIELDPTAFKKLQKEITLKPIRATALPGEQHQGCFYWGQYPNVKGEMHEVAIREDRVQLWQEDSEYRLLTETLYYEVITDKAIIDTIKLAS